MLRDKMKFDEFEVIRCISVHGGIYFINYNITSIQDIVKMLYNHLLAIKLTR